MEAKKRRLEEVKREDAVREYANRIQPRWLKRSNIERRSVDGLSHQEFVRQYELPGVPVIVTGAVGKWRAATEWTPARLLERFGATPFRVSASVDMSLGEYLTYAEACGQREERPLYLFDKDFCGKCPEMAAEFEIPEYFKQDLMSVVGPRRRPDYRWLIIGPALAGSSFHVDPNENFAWNATIAGRKKWVLYPPGCPPPSSADDERQLCLPRWFREHYDDDEHADVRLECVTEAGELLFVPRGWWHCVLNLELCVALTHNVVTEHNLLPALDFLEQDASCGPGEGCRGATKFCLSGDVPASVIYPFEQHVLAQTPPPTTSQVGAPGADEPAANGGGCSCARERRALLRDLRVGLERERPGLVASLVAERERRSAAATSVWSKVVGAKASAGRPGGEAQLAADPAAGAAGGGAFLLADVLGEGLGVE